MACTETIYPYIKLRKNFGRQPQFLEDHGRVHANIKPNKVHRKKVLREAYVAREIQAVTGKTKNPTNTMRTIFKSVSFTHSEGGWPRDVDIEDPETTTRYRRKLEKDDEFQISIPILAEEIEQHVQFNNTVNLYGDYWSGKDDLYRAKDKPQARIIESFTCPTDTPATVRNMCWSEDHTRIAVAYCPYEFDPYLRYCPTQAYFWELSNPTRPEASVRAQTQIIDVRYHPNNAHCIVGALFNGQVCTWDARLSNRPQNISNLDISHKDCCVNAIWTASKTNREFFSLGMDGQVIWWDERNLNDKVDQMWLDPRLGTNKEDQTLSGSVLNYDSSVPTKFMVGTEQGKVMVCRRKGAPEEKLLHVYDAHFGSVRAIDRNPLFLKNFLTSGSHRVKIWDSLWKHTSIFSTALKLCVYVDGQWIPTRPSAFMACRSDGNFDAWDLLAQPVKPTISIKVFNEMCTKLLGSRNGRLVAVGSKEGEIRLVHLDESITTFSEEEKSRLENVLKMELRKEETVNEKEKELRLRNRKIPSHRPQGKFGAGEDDEENLTPEERKKSKKLMAVHHALEGDDELDTNMKTIQLRKEKQIGEKFDAVFANKVNDVDIMNEYSDHANTEEEYKELAEKSLELTLDFFKGINREIEELGVEAFPHKMGMETISNETGSENQLSDVSPTELAVTESEVGPDESSRLLTTQVSFMTNPADDTAMAQQDEQETDENEEATEEYEEEYGEYEEGEEGDEDFEEE